MRVKKLTEKQLNESFMMKRFEEVIHEKHERNDLRVMRILFKDLRQWVKSMPKEQLTILR